MTRTMRQIVPLRAILWAAWPYSPHRVGAAEATNDIAPGEFVIDPSTLIFSITTSTNYTSSDYNGCRLNPDAAVSFRWNLPPATVTADFAGPGKTPHLDTREFKTLGDYSNATGQDRHSVLVDYDVFVNVRRLDAQDAATVQKLYKAEEFDFSLKPGSAAIDRGTVLPNVTDRFAGRAPDLGALEAGAAAPHYGPR